MVRSRLAFLKHFFCAILLLGLCICGLEFSLHLYEACAGSPSENSERSICAPSWMVHHILKPDARIATVNPDSGTAVSWTTNSIGLRGPEFSVPKPPGVFRIVCLGDESTLAAETPDAATFCTRLGELLRSVSSTEIEVINAGCPQYCPLLSYLQLRHSLLALSPDLVVYNFDMSDVVDDHRCRPYARLNGSVPLFCTHPELERQRAAGQKLWLQRLLMWRQCARGLGCVLGGSNSPDDLRDINSPQAAYAWLRDETPEWSAYIEQTLDVIGQLSRLCRQANCEFVLAAIPCPWQISADASDGPGVRARAGVEDHALLASTFPFDTLSGFASKESIPFCDASSPFRRVEQPEQLFYKNAPRFSETGHELYARVLGGFLRRSVSGPWNSGAPSRTPRRLSSNESNLPDSRPLRRTGFTSDSPPAANRTADNEDSQAKEVPATKRDVGNQERPTRAGWEETP